MNERGISAIVAVVLMILITVAGVVIIWVAIVPMVRVELAFQDAGLVSVVVSDGWTFCDPYVEVIYIQVKQAAGDVNVGRIKLIVSYKGKTYSQLEDAPGPNNMRTYAFNMDWVGCDFDWVSVAPIIKGDEGPMAGKMDIPLGRGVAVPAVSCWGQLDGGSYTICTCGDLQNMNTQLSWDYVLSNDVDCSDTINWNSGAGFVPVGNWTNKFGGSFNGQGFEIEDLFIDRPTMTYVGLFGVVYESGPIYDLIFLNSEIYGADAVGTLVGYAYDNEIWGCVISGGLVNATGNYVGGLIGLSDQTNVSDCHFEGDISGDTAVGGIVGEATFFTYINKLSSMGTIKADSEAGGLVGYGDWVYVNQSYSDADAYCGSWDCGGLIGNFDTGYIIDSYSTGNVSAMADVSGGLIGRVSGGIIINRTYAKGEVTGGGALVGGLVGKDDGAYECYNSHWDNETSGQETSVCGVKNTTVEMQQQSTFINWDFVGVWGIDEGVSYPCLLWEVGCS